MPHPRTLLGAARMTLTPPEGREGLHLKACAACWLGYHEEARSLWQRMAYEDDAAALHQLGRMAELGLGEPCDLPRANAFYLRAAHIRHQAATAIRANLDERHENAGRSAQLPQMSLQMAAYQEAP